MCHDGNLLKLWYLIIIWQMNRNERFRSSKRALGKGSPNTEVNYYNYLRLITGSIGSGFLLVRNLQFFFCDGFWFKFRFPHAVKLFPSLICRFAGIRLFSSQSPNHFYIITQLKKKLSFGCTILAHRLLFQCRFKPSQTAGWLDSCFVGSVFDGICKW